MNSVVFIKKKWMATNSDLCMYHAVLISCADPIFSLLLYLLQV